LIRIRLARARRQYPFSEVAVAPLLDRRHRRAYPDRLCVLDRACGTIRAQSHAIDRRSSVAL